MSEGKKYLYKVMDNFYGIVTDNEGEFGIEYWDSEECTSIKWFKTEENLIKEFERIAKIKKENAKKIIREIDENLLNAKLELERLFKSYKNQIKN